jgi:hypothetical protein
MQNYISQFSQTLLDFGNAHQMVDAVHFVRSVAELDNMVFDRKTMLIMIQSADIDNEAGRPIYSVEYAIGIIDKFANEGLYGHGPVVEESLFVLSQLQHHLQQEGWSAVFGEVDVQGDWDESGELVAVLSGMTAQFGRSVDDIIAF